MSEFVSPTILVTGATSGIGYATAQNLLACGATVVLHGPTPRSVDKALAGLAADGADASRLHAVAANFSRLAEVRAMAVAVLARLPRIDVLVNNAAIAGPDSRTLTEDGNEMTFQVNYLAPYLLTRLLTPRLRASRGRMVAVTSNLHRVGNINWSDPQRQKNYAPVAAYAQSKLTLTMFARAMAGEPAGLTAVSLHPGVAETALLPIYSRTGGPVTEAAAAVARLSWPTVAVRNGAYHEDSVPAAPAPLVDNRDAVARLRRVTNALLDLDGTVGEAA